ncbi:MAG: HEAT repeat domain-containing protein [Chloroflexi bacterium]|nr:HEAT repeat domain-containing protein [Chloroflexota bacterium]
MESSSDGKGKSRFQGRKKGRSADRARERIANTQFDGEPGAIDQLLDALNDPDPQARFRAVKALGRMRERQAVPMLMDMLDDPVLQVAQVCIQALGVIGDQQAISALIPLIDHPELGMFALASLRRLGYEPKESPPPQFENFFGASRQPEPSRNGMNGNSNHHQRPSQNQNNPRSRQSARDENEMEWLISALRSDDPVERARAAKSLGKRGDWRATEPLIRALHESKYDPANDDPLDQLGDSAVEPLIASLQDADASVRVLAVMALAKIGDGRAAEPLVAALQDSDELVQMAVWTALVDMGRPAVEPLISALRDNNPDIQRSAALALGELGDDAAVDSLVEVLTDIDYRARSAAAKALGQIGDYRAVPAMMVALRDKDITVRRRAATALGDIGDPRAIEALVWAMEDHDHIVSHSAIIAIHNIMRQQVDRSLDRLIKDLYQSNIKVRASAIVAIGWLGDKRAIPPLVEALSDAATESYLQSLIIESLRKLRQSPDAS